MKQKTKAKKAPVCDFCSATRTPYKLTQASGLTLPTCELCLALGGVSIQKLVLEIKENLAQ